MNECCKKPENLELVEQTGDLQVQIMKCKICGCRHYEVEAEAGIVGLEIP